MDRDKDTLRDKRDDDLAENDEAHIETIGAGAGALGGAAVGGGASGAAGGARLGDEAEEEIEEEGAKPTEEPRR